MNPTTKIYRSQVGDMIEVGKVKRRGCGYPREGTVLKVARRADDETGFFAGDGGFYFNDANDQNDVQKYTLVSKTSDTKAAEPTPETPTLPAKTSAPAEPAPTSDPAEPAPTLVYIAGPFRAESNWGVQQNVRRAEELALEATLRGAQAGVRIMPVCPHKNTSNFHGYRPDLLTDDFWLAGTLELMRRCDAVLLTKGWRKSTGTRAEVKEARRLGIPVFERIVNLVAWIKAGRPVTRFTPAKT